MGGTHWGAIAAGVGGIATAGALLVSLFLLMQQIRNQQQDRLDRHREHASHVGFWLERPEVDDVARELVVCAHYANTSSQPVLAISMVVGFTIPITANADLVRPRPGHALAPPGRRR